MQPEPEPKVSAKRLPRSDVQAAKLGLMLSFLLDKGYTVRPMPKGKNVQTSDGGEIIGVVENEGVPVASLAFVGEEQVGFHHTQFGLQFIYDTQALIKSKHWPSKGPLFETEESQPDAAAEDAGEADPE